MGRRRREIPTPHREFFRAVTIDETVALSCTCSRGADHWYAEPMGEAPRGGAPRPSTRTGTTGTTATPEADGPRLSLRAPRRSPDRAGLAW
jgi:hypothetical protein